MDKVEQLISDYSDSISEHRVWLKPFGKQRLKRWEDFLKSNPEGAICEAATRKLLCDHSIKVNPNEDISGGGPDFLCVKNNKSFYVEATCITKKAATNKSGLADMPPGSSGTQAYALLTKNIFYEMCNKTPQCSNLDATCILAIGTLHFQSGCLCFNKMAAENILTGTTQIAMKVDPKQGCGVGDIYESTDLRDSAFVRFDKTSTGQIEFARNPISAILLCPFGCSPSKVLGVLHPNPNHKFDWLLLPEIRFCRLADGWQKGQFKVEWI